MRINIGNDFSQRSNQRVHDYFKFENEKLSFLRSTFDPSSLFLSLNIYYTYIIYIGKGKL